MAKVQLTIYQNPIEVSDDEVAVLRAPGPPGRGRGTGRSEGPGAARRRQG